MNSYKTRTGQKAWEELFEYAQSGKKIICFAPKANIPELHKQFPLIMLAADGYVTIGSFGTVIIVGKTKQEFVDFCQKLEVSYIDPEPGKCETCQKIIERLQEEADFQDKKQKDEGKCDDCDFTMFNIYGAKRDSILDAIKIIKDFGCNFHEKRTQEGEK